LALQDTGVDDNALVNVEPLTRLTELNLGGTKITDSGITHLRALKDLELLVLQRTQVSDAGLDQVRALKKLKTLDVRGTHVTRQHAIAIQQVLPFVEVLIGPMNGSESLPRMQEP
jgi:Leucine-rich repeat (LRR) protein